MSKENPIIAWRPETEYVIPVPCMAHLANVKVLHQDGVPCGHPGCASHLIHPCEACDRIGARGIVIESSEAKDGQA